MRFFWKVFFIFTSLFAIVFSVFGTWLISETFKASLDREIQSSDIENQMFQFAFETSFKSFPNSPSSSKTSVPKEVIQSITKSLGKNSSYYKVYDSQKNLIFSDAPIEGETEIIASLNDGNISGYQIIEDNGHYYLIIICKVNVKQNSYYLESIKDITSIYNNREQLFDKYYYVMVVLLVFVAFIILFISCILTRSIASLSKITRRFAEGYYDDRAINYSDDEIGELAKDFNFMADNLSQKIEELYQAARKQENFTAAVAHELKTPLTSIIGYADILRTMELPQEESMEYAHYIYTQGKRLESLSYKLLELIVVEKQEYTFVPINISYLFNNIKKIVQPSLISKNLYLHIKLEQATIYGEPELLISLFVNLIDNARKASKNNSDIQIIGYKHKNGYEIKVSDSGCGIPEEDLNKITEAFYMVDKSRARKEGGAGIGMTLCSKIINLHHANWNITSEEGRGTNIVIFFPHRELHHEKP